MGDRILKLFRGGENNMGNKSWYYVLVFCLCLFSFAVISGCGSAAAGGGGTPVSSVSSGRLVDPAIVNAIVFIDVDGNGSYNALVTGEQIATTDANGYFTFTETPSMGATVKILVQGLHLGITYDAILKRPVDGIAGLNMTPLTTMLANGISADAIIYIIKTYAGVTIEDAADIVADPMAGFSPTSPRSIAKLRGAICAYCLMQIISKETGISGGYFDAASIESGPDSADIKNGLAQMGSAVRSALPDDMVGKINAIITGIHDQVTLETDGMIPVNIPPATVDDVASTAFVITRWVMQHSIANSGSGYFPGTAALASIEAYAGKVGMREYLLRNRTAVIFNVPSWAPPEAPHPLGDWTYEMMVDHNMMYEGPGGGTLVATGEIAASVKGYDISYPAFNPTIIKVN